jgi:hypothetical protein
LVEPCIKAGTSERGCCPQCGKPWERVVEVGPSRNKHLSTMPSVNIRGVSPTSCLNHSGEYKPREREATGWQPGCACEVPAPDGSRVLVMPDPVPCTVFDPFAGSGTTVVVARALGRHGVGLDLSYPYLHDQARARLQLDALDAWTNGKRDGAQVDDLPLFSAIPAE